MKKILAALMLLGIFAVSDPTVVNASWWYDFTHSDNDDYVDDSYLYEDNAEEEEES